MQDSSNTYKGTTPVNGERILSSPAKELVTAGDDGYPKHSSKKTKTPPPPPSRTHIAVCAFPFGAHASTLLLLIKRVATIATHIKFSFINQKSSNDALFKPRDDVGPLPSNIIPCSLDEDQLAFDRFITVAPVILRHCVTVAEKKVGRDINCLIGDAILWFCGEIANEKGVDWIPVWASGSASLSCHLYHDVLRSRFSEVQGQGKNMEIGNCVPGLSTARFCDIPSEIIDGNLESPFSQMLYKMSQMLPEATAVAINSCEELLPIITNDLKSKLNLLNVGPVFSFSHSDQYECNDKYGCIPWLDKHEMQSVVYISFGTFSSPSQEEIMGLAQGLREVNVPFIWSMSDSVKNQLPASLLLWIGDAERGKIVPWAPQRRILSHPAVGIFITHCGWNSILESIESNVPMICRSIVGDQKLNQRLVEREFKIGVGLEEGCFTKDGVVRGLNQVLFSEVGMKMREKAKVLRNVLGEVTKLGGSFERNFNALMELVTSAR